MNRPLILALAMTALAGAPAIAMTEAECAAAWTKADVNSDGTITDAEGSRYFAALRVANRPAADGKMLKASFLEHCKDGHFNASKLDAGAPLSGSNSYTEAQAKDRAMAAGYTAITALIKDANGVWRGTGTDGGTVKKIAVDFKGNVVAN
jgi:hypothetical protein